MLSSLLPLLLLMPSTLSVPLHQLVPSEDAFSSLPPLQASLPVPNPTRAFWTDSSPHANPRAREGSTGELTQDADVCIIGSGITGVSAAWHLAHQFSEGEGGKKVKVVVLEARDFCSGATGRNGGHLTPFIFLDFASRASRYNTTQAIKSYELENYTSREIVRIIEDAGLQSQVDLVSGGHTTVFVTPEEEAAARKDHAAAVRAGMDLEKNEVRWISKEEMEETYGASFPGVTFTGHNLWPLKFVSHLFGLSRSLAPDSFELILHTHTPVTYITPIHSSSSTHARRWTLGTPRGPISCISLIHATNAYASHLLPHLAGPAGIVPARGQIIALRAAAPSSQIGKSSWDGNDGFEYWFPRPLNGSDMASSSTPQDVRSAEGSQKPLSDEKGDSTHPLIILGGGRESTAPHFEYGTTDDADLNANVSQALRDFLPGLFPGRFEEGRKPEMEWSGIMGYTKSHDPFVGPVLPPDNTSSTEFAGQYISAGYTGHGMPRAYACAEVVAGMVAAELEGKTYEVPEWLPKHYLTTERGS